MNLDKIRKEIWRKKVLSEERKDICFSDTADWDLRPQWAMTLTPRVFTAPPPLTLAELHLKSSFRLTVFWIIFSAGHIWLLSLTLCALGGAVNPSGPSHRKMWQTGSFYTATFTVSAPQSSSARCSSLTLLLMYSANGAPLFQADAVCEGRRRVIQELWQL